MNSEVESIWKNVAVDKFEALSLHFHGDTEENYRKHYSGVAGLWAEVYNSGLPEYECRHPTH
jgi:hypothetical protein